MQKYDKSDATPSPASDIELRHSDFFCVGVAAALITGFSASTLVLSYQAAGALIVSASTAAVAAYAVLKRQMKKKRARHNHRDELGRFAPKYGTQGPTGSPGVAPPA
jgi:hypothetical protein